MPRWLLNVVLVCCAVIALVVVYVLIGSVHNRIRIGDLEHRPVPSTAPGPPGPQGPAGPPGSTQVIPTTRSSVRSTATTRPATGPGTTTSIPKSPDPTTTTTMLSPPCRVTIPGEKCLLP